MWPKRRRRAADHDHPERHRSRADRDRERREAQDAQRHADQAVTDSDKKRREAREVLARLRKEMKTNSFAEGWLATIMEDN